MKSQVLEKNIAKKKKNLLNHVKSLAARQTDFIDQDFSIKMIFS